MSWAETALAVWFGGAVHMAMINCSRGRGRNDFFYLVFSVVYWLPLSIEILLDVWVLRREEPL